MEIGNLVWLHESNLMHMFLQVRSRNCRAGEDQTVQLYPEA